jgi:hypothetical protein
MSLAHTAPVVQASQGAADEGRESPASLIYQVDLEVAGPYLPRSAIHLDPDIPLARARLERLRVLTNDLVPAIRPERRIVVRQAREKAGSTDSPHSETGSG